MPTRDFCFPTLRISFFFLTLRRPPISTLFPYTTLFPILTGASRGLGRAIALKLAAEGAQVALNYRSGEAQARQVADEIASRGGTTLLIRADVSLKDEARAMVAKVIDHWGHLDILVNNAGITR